jgi:hypothetical protein
LDLDQEESDRKGGDHLFFLLLLLFLHLFFFPPGPRTGTFFCCGEGWSTAWQRIRHGAAPRARRGEGARLGELDREKERRRLGQEMVVWEEKGSEQGGDWRRERQRGDWGRERCRDWGRDGLAARVFIGLGYLIYHAVKKQTAKIDFV